MCGGRYNTESWTLIHKLSDRVSRFSWRVTCFSADSEYLLAGASLHVELHAAHSLSVTPSRLQPRASLGLAWSFSLRSTARFVPFSTDPKTPPYM